MKKLEIANSLRVRQKTKTEKKTTIGAKTSKKHPF